MKILGDAVALDRLYPRGAVDVHSLSGQTCNRVSKDIRAKAIELIEFTVIRRAALFRRVVDLGPTWE